LVFTSQTTLERVQNHRFLSIQLAIRRVRDRSQIHPGCIERRHRFMTVDRCRRFQSFQIAIRGGCASGNVLFQEAVLNRTLDNNGDGIITFFMTLNFEAA